MKKDTVIKVEGLWKQYGLPLPSFIRKRSNLLRPFQPKPNKMDLESGGGAWALRDLNFNLHRGEILGIIGRNGAGKSTLLKVLAGVTPPTRGKVEVRGQVFPMIELNAGLHVELTGRENVRLLGVIMGLSLQKIKAKMTEIEEFCELGKWFDQPVRKYSSGMLARLGFSVALHTEASILFIDEILAVGDISFRQKCVRWLDDCRHNNISVIFVSHSLNQIERLCDRALFIDQGKMQFIGGVKEACSRYYENVNDEILNRIRQSSNANPIPIEGSNEIRILNIRLLNAKGEEIENIKHGEDLRVVIELQVAEFVKAPNFTVVIINSDLNPVAHATTLGKVEVRPDFPAGLATVECRFQNLSLLKGIYTMDVGMAEHQARYRIGGVACASQFQVIEPIDNYHMLTTGHFALPSEWFFSPSLQEVKDGIK